jgi:hypothetical protein
MPPAPPKFPSIEELITEQIRASSPDAQRHSRRSRTGMFQELLQSRPEAIYVDSLEHPDKYAEELRALLTELVNTRRQPTSDERLKLDAAVLDFMAAPPAPRAALKKEQPRVTKLPEFKTPDFATHVDDVAPGPEPALSEGTQPRAFWWL